MSKKDTIARGCPSRKGAGTCAKLDVHDWLQDIPNSFNNNDIVEIRFKNTRKDYYRNVNDLQLNIGDMVAVESSPGHDIGIVSLVGDLVLNQMKRHKVTYVDGELRKVYRHVKESDVERWREAVALEQGTMLKARKIAEELQLNMKIGDVEYQGDKSKAIFYYIADERVDFRTLIKVYAETFRIRIEMKQIGARQEAGRIGGIGPCGRELCCSSWMSNFVSVSTSAARYQGLSLNPQKLAGQCSKLKCCLNYELDCYVDAQKDFPRINIPLYAESGKYSFQKADVFKGIFWYFHESGAPGAMIGLTVKSVKKILKENRDGVKRERLESEVFIDVEGLEDDNQSFEDVVGQDSLDRFDNKQRKPKSKPKARNKNRVTKGAATEPKGDRPVKGRGPKPERKPIQKSDDSKQGTNPKGVKRDRPVKGRGPKPGPKLGPKQAQKPVQKSDDTKQGAGPKADRPVKGRGPKPGPKLGPKQAQKPVQKSDDTKQGAGPKADRPVKGRGPKPGPKPGPKSGPKLGPKPAQKSDDSAEGVKSKGAKGQRNFKGRGRANLNKRVNRGQDSASGERTSTKESNDNS